MSPKIQQRKLINEKLQQSKFQELCLQVVCKREHFGRQQLNMSISMQLENQTQNMEYIFTLSGTKQVGGYCLVPL